MKKIIGRPVRWFLGRSLVVKIIIVIAIFVLGWFLYSRFSGSGRKVRYQTAKVERGTIISSVSASGEVVAVGRMPVTTLSTGQVKAVLVKDGDAVSAGQRILELTLDATGQQKHAQAWSTYLQAKTSLDSAQATLYSLQSDMLLKWKAYMDLAQGDSYENEDGTPKADARTLPQFMSPQDDWLFTEAKYKNQQGVISQTQAAVSAAWSSYQTSSPFVTAPTAGIITDLTYVPGMSIQAGDTTTSTTRIGTIISEGPAIASVTISEVDVNSVQNGQKADITIDSLPGKTFTGVVVGINKSGVVTSGVTTYPVTIQLDTMPEGLLPNMAVTANIRTASKEDVLMVPSVAVQVRGRGSVVRIVRKGEPVEVPVTTGLSSDTQTEILDGLSVGEEVVTGMISNGSNSSNNSPFSPFRVGGGAGGGALRPGGGNTGTRRQ